MTIGLVGRKCGMTRVFTEDGASVPVTVIEALPNRVTQVKTQESDGYRALQVTTGTRKASRVQQTVARAVRQRRALKRAEGFGNSVSLTAKATTSHRVAEIKVDLFEAGQKVDVTGTTIGKGFAGASSVTTSACRTPPTATRCRIARRVRLVRTRRRAACSKARRCRATWAMRSRTAENLEVVRVDAERNLILIRGAVPGASGGRRDLRPAIKARG